MSRGKFISEGRSRILDLSEIKTYDSHDRRNLVRIDNMMNVGDPHEEYTSDGFNTLVDRVVAARKNGRPVIFSMGAHVIKNRLSRYLIAMIKEGITSHISRRTAQGASTTLSSRISAGQARMSRRRSRTAPSECGNRPADG